MNIIDEPHWIKYKNLILIANSDRMCCYICVMVIKHKIY